MRLAARALSSQAASSRLSKLRDTLSQDCLPGMELDLSRLQTCLRGNFKDPRYFGEEAPPPFVRQLNIGENPTYALKFSDPACRKLVIRFHEDMAKHEFAATASLHANRLTCSVPVAQPHVLLEDATLMGAPFYISDYVAGRTFSDAALAQSSIKPEERRQLHGALVDLAAALHTVDMGQVSLAPREADSGRQLSEQSYFATLTRDAADDYAEASERALSDCRFTEPMDYLRRWLPLAVPTGDDTRLSLVHGNLHAENVIFHPIEPRVAALVDWESWVVGHPGVDLARLGLAYATPSTLATEYRGFGSEAERQMLGIPSEEEFLSRYVAKSGLFAVRENFDYYIAHTCFRLAAARVAADDQEQLTDEDVAEAAALSKSGVERAKRFDVGGWASRNEVFA